MHGSIGVCLARAGVAGVRVNIFKRRPPVRAGGRGGLSDCSNEEWKGIEGSRGRDSGNGMELRERVWELGGLGAMGTLSGSRHGGHDATLPPLCQVAHLSEKAVYHRRVSARDRTVGADWTAPAFLGNAVLAPLTLRTADCGPRRRQQSGRGRGGTPRRPATTRGWS